MNIKELKKWFAKRELPSELQLNEWTKIEDVKKCVDSCFAYLDAHPKNEGYLPYYELLIEIKNKIEN